jgi:hypothetical protein
MTQPLISELLAAPVRWQVAGTIAVPAADTAALLLAVEPGRVGDGNALVLADLPTARRGALSIAAGPVPGSFYAVGVDEPIELAVDPSVPAIAVRSWFAGMHTVEPAANGSRVVHRVHSIQPGHERLADGMHTRMGDRLTQVLRVIADRFGAPQNPQVRSDQRREQ